MPLAVAFLLFHSAPHVSHHPCSHSSVSMRCRYVSQSMSTSKERLCSKTLQASRLASARYHPLTRAKQGAHVVIQHMPACLPACLTFRLSI